MNGPYASRGDGQHIHPGDAIVPIIKEVGENRLSVIGTGFYLTRYGLFATAKHVIEALVDETSAQLAPSFVLHLEGNDKCYLRKIVRAHALSTADVGIAQADNFMSDWPQNPLQNLRPILTTGLPHDGAPLTTYAYPENEILLFNVQDHTPEIRGDYFQGGFLRFVEQPENPSLKFAYIETSIELRHGASGGPVFDHRGRIIGVNCRGWDFRGAEHEGGGHLSYIVPIGYLLGLEVDTFMVPSVSWEAQQIPAEKACRPLTVRELAEYGHILFEPPLR